MAVVHANFTGTDLHLWAETGEAADGMAAERAHPFAADPGRLRQALGPMPAELREATIELRLPTADGSPTASPTLAHHSGSTDDEAAGAASFETWSVPTLACPAAHAPRILEHLVDLSERSTRGGDLGATNGRLYLADSAWYFATAARLGIRLLSEQRFVPMLDFRGGKSVRGEWAPWLSDKEIGGETARLLSAMPPSARAVVDAQEHDGWNVTRSFISAVVDGLARQTMLDEDLHEAIEDRDPEADPHVAILSGLLNQTTEIKLASTDPIGIARTLQTWVATLEDHGRDASWKLQLVLDEPDDDVLPPDLAAPSDGVRWPLRFRLMCVDRPELVVEAADVWLLRAESVTIEGRRLDSPQELLLAELGRAVRIYPKLERALSESAPESIELTTREAYDLLREVRPLLIEQGVSVRAPSWWDSSAARLGARLLLRSDELSGPDGAPSPSSAARPRMGLNSLVDYEWRLAVGDTPLSLEEFERLAAQKTPLVRLNGQWIEVRPEHMRAAIAFVRENPGGQMEIGRALHMAYTREAGNSGLNITGVDAHGWVSMLLGGSTTEHMRLPELEPPEGFHGHLREYQQRGVSWLAFLDSLGLGACLADDMGLGKTIQLLALLEHERAQRHDGVSEGPTLLVVPMSIVRNWEREARRFTPDLAVLVHHGPERLTGDAFIDAANQSDLVVTTYGLAQRDVESLELIGWRRVVLDEAQNIKNPQAKQSKAVRRLNAPRRITLTGTPVENRLSELWSIMDFCNPGLLGSAGEFRRLFGVPIERHRDADRSGQLRELVRPFVLRRLKTDPKVITDLPDKVETKEYCQLTSEQAELYQAYVKRMMHDVDEADPQHRRGLVLTALIRLKQICNHPAQIDADRIAEGSHTAARSGKCIRLIEMLDEVMSSGAQSLIFTQFRAMGDLLVPILRHAFDRDVLFLHGGVPPKKRQEMVDRFQRADGTAPIFILSLKAGGLGLNLTAATHVFHFDRWWNPAVENQATDRAFRIGQTKNVHVHKFIVSGTLEDRIDQMIESKIELAEGVIGSDEAWLTELSTEQLREVLELRSASVFDQEGVA